MNQWLPYSAQDDRGQNLLEYALLVAFVAVLVLLSLASLGLSINTTFGDASSKVAGATSPGSGSGGGDSSGSAGGGGSPGGGGGGPGSGGSGSGSGDGGNGGGGSGDAGQGGGKDGDGGQFGVE
jgi:Flp pilus assembly pilin Flp